MAPFWSSKWSFWSVGPSKPHFNTQNTPQSEVTAALVSDLSQVEPVLHCTRRKLSKPTSEAADSTSSCSCKRPQLPKQHDVIQHNPYVPPTTTFSTKAALGGKAGHSQQLQRAMDALPSAPEQEVPQETTEDMTVMRRAAVQLSLIHI